MRVGASTRALGNFRHRASRHSMVDYRLDAGWGRRRGAEPRGVGHRHPDAPRATQRLWRRRDRRRRGAPDRRHVRWRFRPGNAARCGARQPHRGLGELRARHDDPAPVAGARRLQHHHRRARSPGNIALQWSRHLRQRQRHHQQHRDRRAFYRRLTSHKHRERRPSRVDRPCRPVSVQRQARRRQDRLDRCHHIMVEASRSQ